MDMRVDVVTLAVPDLPEAHSFYAERLGWEPALTVPDEVTFLRAGKGRVLSLFSRADLHKDIGDALPTPPYTLGQVFNSAEEVDAAVEAMTAAGATIRKPPQRPELFPGYHAYVQAPDGAVWELVYNPEAKANTNGLVNVGDVKL